MSEFKFRALNEAVWEGLDNISLEYDEGLRLKEGEESGEWTSERLDSGILGCKWHRLALDVEIPDGCQLVVSLCTFESSSGGEFQAKSVIAFEEWSDFLIEIDPGRYIQLKIGFSGTADATPVLERVKVYYPHSSLVRYLPALYQDNSDGQEFLERFLSVFETELLATEEIIDRIPSIFDPMAVPDELLYWLAGWLSLDLYELLGKRNREFIQTAMALYRKKGTISGLGDLVSFLTGRRCCVKEYANNVFRSYGNELRSYGMEHGDIGNPVVDGCTRFYHKTSKTVDTSNADLLGRMGTFSDEVHYTMDTREGALSCPWGVGLYIYLESGETLEIDPKELYQIIRTFLPVFVQVRIIPYTIEAEVYNLCLVDDEYMDILQGGAAERFEQVVESYWSYSSWKLMRSYVSSIEELTNNLQYRTFHDQLIPETD